MAHVHGQPPPLPDTVPPDVRDLIARAMAKQPADRPASAEAMAGELRALLMRLTPPPIVTNEYAPATLVETSVAPTQHMPAAGVAVGAPNIVIDRRVVAAPAKRRARTIAPVVVAVAVACVLLVALARHDGARTLGVPGSTADVSTTAGPTTAVPTTAVATDVAASVTTVAATVAPAMVEIDPAAYIGKPYNAAHDALEGLGFHVVQAKEGKGHSGDTVLDVQPTGSVAFGSTVTLTVSGGKGKD